MAQKSQLVLSLDANQLGIYMALLEEGIHAFARNAFALPPDRGLELERMLSIVDFGIEITEAIKQHNQSSGSVQAF